MVSSTIGPSMWMSIGVCVFYGTSSMLVSLVNKLIYSKYDFNLTSLLLLIQSLGSIIFIGVVYISQTISESIKTFYVSNKVVLPKREAFRARFFPTLVISLTNLANISCGILGLKYIDIPMFLTLRRLVTPCTLAATIISTKLWPSRNIFLAVGFISTGAIVAGFNDLNANYFGYFLVFMNNVLSVAYYEVLSRISKKYKDLSFYEIYIFSNIQMLPTLYLLCSMNDEFRKFNDLPYKSDPVFLSLIAFASVLGVCITVGVQMCTIINSPLATTITGNMKDIFSTILGVLVFNVKLNVMMVLGICISLSGGMVYSATKYKESQNPNKSKDKELEEVQMNVPREKYERV